MCPYCEKDEAGNVAPIRSGGTNDWYVDVEGADEGADLYIEYDENGGHGHGVALIAIAYCPMCGRKLRGDA